MVDRIRTGTGTTTRANREDAEPPHLTTPPPELRLLKAPPKPLPSTSAQVDVDVAMFLRASMTEAKEKERANQKAAEAKAGPRNDKILYVGINDESTGGEIGMLSQMAPVTSVLRKDGASVQLDGKNYDLTTDDGCSSFGSALAEKFHLPPEVGGKVAFAIWNSKPAEMRDELARIAMALAPGEAGGSIPSRMVFSGHSTGNDVHRGSEHLLFDSILSLAQAMPNAAKQIEDVHLSGCFTEKQVFDAKIWQRTFPNLKTMWGYSSFAKPGEIPSHFQSWEHSTRGRAGGSLSHGDAVVSWSAKDGIKSSVPLEWLRTHQHLADARFDALRSGERETTNAHSGEAASDYAMYRQLSHRPELSEQERKEMGKKADILYRVRFFNGEGVAKEFAKANRDVISDAYKSVGLPAPDIEKLSLKEVIKAVHDLEAKAATMHPLPEAAQRALPILQGFARLDPKVIPDSWCH